MFRFAVLGLVVVGGVAAGQGQPAEALARQLDEARQQLVRQQGEAARLQRLLDTTTYQHRLDLARREWLDGNTARAQVLLGECPDALRGFEWRLLDRLVRGARVTGVGAGDLGFGLAFRPGDEEVLLVGKDGVLGWDVGPGQEQLNAVPGKPVASPVANLRRAARSLDGDLAAVADDGPDVHLIDLRTGKVVQKIAAPATPVTDLAFSRDGRRLAILAMNAVAVWDVEGRQPVFGMTVTAPGAVGLDLGPAGDTLAVGHVDGGVRVWDLETGQLVVTLRHPVAPSRLRFHPEGDRLAVLAGEKLRVWNLRGPRGTSSEPAGLTAGVAAFAWSPDGTRLVAGAGNVVLVWDAAGRALLETHRGHAGRVRHVAVGTTSRRIASLAEDGVLKVWDVPGHPAGVLLRGHVGTVTAVAWSPDGQHLATAGQDRAVRVWDAATRRVIAALGVHPRPVTGLAYSPDAKTLATGCEDGVVRTWDARTGQPKDDLNGFKGRVTAVAYSPDGKYLAGIDQDGLLQVRTLADATTRGVRLPGAGLFGLAFKPDGSQLAVSCSDLSDVAIRLFDPAGPREVELLKGPRAQPAVAWSPDGTTLAFASSTGTRLLSRKPGGGEVVLRDVAGAFDQATALAFSPDGTRLATTAIGRPARLWDTATGLELLASPDAITGGVLAFSPDGTRLALGEGTGLVRVFEAAPRKEPPTFPDSSYHLAFSPDGRWMATGLRRPEHLLQLWDVEKQRRGPVIDTLGGGLLSHLVYFSPDSAQVRTLQEQHDGGKSKFLVRFWDVATGREMGRTAIEPATPATHWHWNGTHLAVAGSAEAGKPARVEVIDALTGKSLRTIDDVGTRLASLLLAPDGGRVVVSALVGDGAASRTVVWDVETGKAVGEPLERGPEEGHLLSRLTFHPNGGAVAGFASRGEADCSLVVWGPKDGGVVRRVKVPRAEGPLVFSPDGDCVVMPSGPAVRTVRVGTGDEAVHVVAPHVPFAIDRLAFAPGGKKLAVQGSLSHASRVHLIEFPPTDPDRADAKRIEPIRAYLDHRGAATAALADRAWYAAVFHLDRLIQMRPDAPELYRQRGVALVGLDAPARAVPDLTRALQGNLLGVGLGLRSADWKELLPHVEGALVKAPDSWPTHALRGHALAGLGRWPEAVPAFAASVKHGGNPAVVLDRYAAAALGAEDRLLYKRVAGQLLDALGEAKDATTANNVAWACLVGRDGPKPDRPLALARRAVAAATFAPAETRHAYLNTLALALYRSNQLEEAEKTVQAAVAANDGKPSRLDHLLQAMVLAQLGKKDAARLAFDQARLGEDDDPALLGNWEARLDLAQLKAEAEAVIGK